MSLSGFEGFEIEDDTQKEKKKRFDLNKITFIEYSQLRFCYE